MIESARIRPSPWWYASAAVPLVVGIVVGVLLIVTLVRDVASSLHHFSTPGQVTVQLSNGDRRDIFLQTGGALNSAFVPASALDCRVTGPNGPVPVKGADNTRLSTDGDIYRSRFTFEANADGAYTVRCATAERASGAPGSVPLAVGPHLGVLEIVGTVFGVIAAFGGGFLLAVMVAGLVAILRGRSKARLRREAAYPVAPPPGTV
jgi:hypothetical protein